MLPTRLDRASLHRAYAEGLSPVAVIEAALARIEVAADPGIFLHLDAAGALASAASLVPFDPQRQPLWGLPCAIKDNIDVAGMPTTGACPAFAYQPDRDAAAVARLRDAGAIVLGKTNLDQFATGLVGVRTPYPVPRNALDAALVPGGSSSGSAVAVARELVTFALGTDTAGSGRVPAALNGIVGWKPSCGAVSTLGVVPACRSLDCVSVFAGTVDDAWQVFATLAAYDTADPYARERPARGHAARALGTRIAIPQAASRPFFGDAAQAAAFERDVDALRALGATVVEIDFAPFQEVAALLYEGAWLAERQAAVGPFHSAHPDALHPTTAAILAGAARLSAVDAFRDYYRLAALRRRIGDLLAGIDLVAVPSIPRLVTVEEIAADPLGPNRELGTYTNFANLLDFCAVTLPTAPRADGGPASLTLLARGGEDGRLLPWARALVGEAEPLPTLGPNEVELVVVGAHLSGMPLNDELVQAGGRLVRTSATAPCYRLFDLGGEPPRPGLLRVAEDAGAAVETEVWALPLEALGPLVAAIAAPLGVGRIRLADGTAPTGFLVEAVGIEGALDITAHGGWRAYRAAARDAASAADRR